MNSRINFFNENLEYIVQKKKELRRWIFKVIEGEGYVAGELNFIFCDDQLLLGLNEKYLNHNTLTDILTFSLEDKEGVVGGDIYISIQRVKENAVSFRQKTAVELHRVMIHGVLHLIGYKDKSKQEKLEMTEKENFYLGIFQSTSLSYQ